MRDMSDLVPTLAVVAAFAQTSSTIHGVGFIRNKESDRIGDLAHELRILGVLVDELDDGLTVHPSKPHSGTVNTHHDHRIAMSLALIGLVTPGVVINDPMVVTKSWPEYWTMLGALQ
jgi:3-phosphoshikimate 1-carboxyvinyltransferase